MTSNYKFVGFSIPILSICLLLLSSCGAGFNSNFEELSGDSYFRESGGALNSIKSHNRLHKTIYSKVIAYAYNDDFIIAAQKPNFEYHMVLIASDLNTGVEDVGVLQKAADSILTHDPYYIKIFSNKINFWIIVNKSHELIGPLTKEEYQAKKNELGIPDDLKLDINQ